MKMGLENKQYPYYNALRQAWARLVDGAGRRIYRLYLRHVGLRERTIDKNANR